MNLRFTPRLQGIRAAPDSVFGKIFNKQETTEQALDRDKDGNLLYKEDIISFVKSELDRRRQDRLPLERQWTLNSNFIMGNQYCEINLNTGEIGQVLPLHDWLSRETFNRITPLMQVRRANLNKLSYVMKVNPQTNEFDDTEKAEVSTKILRHKQNTSNFNKVKNKMLAWSELTGTSFLMSWWNKDAGEEYARIDELSEDGNTTKKIFYEGDVEYCVLTPYEVYPENIFKETIEEQRSIIIEQVKNVDEIYDLYGVKVKGKNIDTFSVSHVTVNTDIARTSTAMALRHHTADNSEKVITYFEKKSRLYPDGRLIIIVGDSELVYYGNLPYKDIPIIKNTSQDAQGMFFGRSVIEDLIPLQRALNGCINRIHEYIKRLAIGSCFVEEGSVDIDELTDEGFAPGKVIPYQKGYEKPEMVQIGSIPAEVMAERKNLLNDMEYVAGVSQLSATGSLPSGVTAASAIENLAAIDSTRMSLTADNAREAIKELAKLWLSIYKQYANTKRVLNYVGMNSAGSALRWSKEDITDCDVSFTTENELLLSEDMQKQRFIEAYNMGAFTDENGVVPQNVKNKVIEMSKIGNYSEIMSINTLQMQKAQRENAYFETGIMPIVSEFDDDAIHIEEHTRYVLQAKFDIFKRSKPEMAKEFENHIKSHKEKIAKETMAKMQQLQMNGGMHNG